MNTEQIKSNKSTNPTYQSTKLKLATALESYFAIPDELQSELAEYKMYYWSVEYLLNQLDNYSCLHLIIKDQVYLIRFMNTNYTELNKLCAGNSNTQIRISFRRARAHWNLPAYCLVKLPAQPRGRIF